MRRHIFRLINILVLMVTSACTVISPQVRSVAEPDIPFDRLVAEVEKYKGHIVILGGYILETTNLESETILHVLQVPLRIGEEPAQKDSSKGRFLVYHPGFLDPEVYSKDRVITVAGEVMGVAAQKIGEDRVRYLKLAYREIYLWPELRRRPYPYPYRFWPYPYDWHRYRHYRYPYWYW